MGPRKEGSRNVLRVVPHGAAVYAGAPGAEKVERRASGGRGRAADSRECGEACAPVERAGAGIQRRKIREEQRSRVTRNGVGAAGICDGQPRRAERKVERGRARGAGASVGTAAKRRREERCVALADVRTEPVGGRYFAVLWRGAGGSSSGNGAGKLPREAGNPEQHKDVGRVSRPGVCSAAAAESHDAAMGGDENAGTGDGGETKSNCGGSAE